MPTTNLSSQSLGDVLVQSGNGSPDHASAIGSLYTNKDTASVFTNVDGTGTGWEQLQRSGFGELTMTATTTVSPSTSAFTAVTSNISLGNANAFTLSTGKLSLSTGRAGKYGCLMTCTIARNAVTTTYEIGITKNGVAPTGGQFQGASVDTTHTVDNVSVFVYLDLVATDTLGLAIKAAGAGNVNITKFALVAYRISD